MYLLSELKLFEKYELEKNTTRSTSLNAFY